MSGIKLGNPAGLIFIGFGFGIGLFGMSQLLPGHTELAGAGAYGVLVAGISLVFGSIWNYLRGETFWAAVCSFFGLWVTLFFFFATSKLVAPQGISLYAFAVIIPLVIFVVISVRLKATALWMTLVSIILLAFFVGMANLPINGTTAFHRVAGVFCLITTILMWYQGAEFLKAMLQEMLGGATAE
jgi:hypothetical protein